MPELPVAVVHADESCLGNGREGSNPGGAAALIEVRARREVARRDLYISAPATTNNRMALAGAIATFAVLAGKNKRLRVVYVSDSEYLVKGMRDWVPEWTRRGWRRKGGAIQNPELWQALVRVSGQHEARWVWVRGHAGDPKNEYANDLAMRAAAEQLVSQAAVESGFQQWLAERRQRGKYLDYDPDAAFARLAAGDASLP
jgi:ribonuclease HI